MAVYVGMIIRSTTYMDLVQRLYICQIATKEFLLTITSLIYCLQFRVCYGVALLTLFCSQFTYSMTCRRNYIHYSQFLKFVNDTSIFRISTLSDHISLQEGTTALFTWSRDSDLDFNLKKFDHLSFKFKLDTRHTAYTIFNISIPHCDSLKTLD